MFSPPPQPEGVVATRPVSVCRKLVLGCGLLAIKLSFSSNIEETIKRVSEFLLKEELVRAGTPIMIVSDILSDHFGANSILQHHE